QQVNHKPRKIPYQIRYTRAGFPAGSSIVASFFTNYLLRYFDFVAINSFQLNGVYIRKYHSFIDKYIVKVIFYLCIRKDAQLLFGDVLNPLWLFNVNGRNMEYSTVHLCVFPFQIIIVVTFFNGFIY